MTFRELQRRLLRLLNQKMQRGEISQRQLARLTGFTQPHIHNVLKGARKMNNELADALLESLNLSLSDLLDDTGGSFGIHGKAPLVRGVIGRHEPFPERLDDAAHLLFPAPFLSRFVTPVLLRLDADEHTMSPLLEPGDVVLVDCADSKRVRPIFERIYALSFHGRGAVCRCQLVGGVLVLAAEDSRRASHIPECLPLGKQNILDIVRGTVVWACRELDVIFAR